MMRPGKQAKIKQNSVFQQLECYIVRSRYMWSREQTSD